MAIKTSLKHSNLGGNPATHSIALWVAHDPGGAVGQSDVNVVITWDPDELTLQLASVTPQATYVGAAFGLVLWQGATVNEAGTDFTVRLTCAGNGADWAEVGAMAEEADGSTRPWRYSMLTAC